MEIRCKSAWLLLHKLRSAIAEKSIIETDALASYRKPLRGKSNHRRQVYDADSQMLVWLHTILSNAKAFVQGTFHGLDELHLQRCLDTFCCRRFKRRHRADRIFFDLLKTVTSAPKAAYADLKG